MTIAIGDKLPAATFKEKTADGPVEISTEQLFAGKRVVLFAVPGAFTPTCSLNHLPGYLENRDTILGKGVDDIAVLAVNDWHVMGAWAQSSGGMGKIHFLADWDARLHQGRRPRNRPLRRRPRPALQAVFDAGGRRLGQGPQRRGKPRPGDGFRRGGDAGTALSFR